MVINSLPPAKNKHTINVSINFQTTDIPTEDDEPSRQPGASDPLLPTADRQGQDNVVSTHIALYNNYGR